MKKAKPKSKPKRKAGKKNEEAGASVGVSRAEIQRIAALAELAVDDAAAAELEVQLTRILGYVAQLGELPAQGPGFDDAGAVRLRTDQPGRADPLAAPPAEWAPAFTQGLFLVPRLGELDRGEDAP